MKDISTWREKFKITHYFVNPDGQASIQGLSYCLQETAVNHATAGKFGYEELIRDNKAWVLTRQMIKLYRIPRVSDKILVESWIDSSTDSISIRDFHILDEKENILGVARTSWMMLDLAVRKPVRIPVWLQENFPHLTGRIKENLPLEKIPLLQDPTEDGIPFLVVYNDLDMNHHVNNIQYLKWVLDGFSYDFRTKYSLASIESNYLSEAIYNDSLIRMTVQDAQNPGIFITNIINSRNKRPILSSRTKWILKEQVINH
jgi:medium-chain acyl-[acyl-carrier-protein] hydrolase